MTLLQANNNNNTISTDVATVAPDQFRIEDSTTIVDALNGNDTITLGNPYRNITVKGGNGNDSINLNSSLVNSVINGGNGNDTTTVAAGASVTNTAFQSLEGNNAWTFNGKPVALDGKTCLSFGGSAPETKSATWTPMRWRV